jgi:phytoene/squalene synthetase
LPREDREQFGYSDQDLHARRFTPAFRELLAYEVGRARAMLLEGRELVPRMPRKIAVDIDLFSRGGLAILDRIERQGFDVWSSRPEVGKLAKAGLLLQAMLSRPGRRGAAKVERPLAESRA